MQSRNLQHSVAQNQSLSKCLWFVVFYLLFTTGAFAANPRPGDPPSREAVAHMTKEQRETRITEIKERVKEIQAMDKSSLSREERKALRKELKQMNKEARVLGGIYISVGALIIIILLLIIIL